MKRAVMVVLCLLLVLWAVGCGKTPAKPQFTLHIIVQGEGDITPDTGSQYEGGTLVKLSAVPATGWAFSYWSGPDGSTVIGTTDDFSTVMDKDKVITPVFVKLNYAVAASVSPANSGTVDITIVPAPYVPVSVGIEHGQIARVYAKPAPGYEFDRWAGDLSGTQNPMDITIEKNTSIQAVFVPVISGQVFGRKSLTPLMGVVIRYTGAVSGQVTTDAKGRYTIKGVSGPVTLTPESATGALWMETYPASRQVQSPQQDVDFALSLLRFSRSWGGSGNTNGLFNNPTGIAVDTQGTLYISDTYNHRIQRYTSEGSFTGTWGSLGASHGQFNFPTGLATDSDNNLYVVDQANNRIQKFSSSGVFLATWGTGGSGIGQFNLPSGVAVDAGGNVYVVERYNHRVQKFTSSGTYLAGWGSNGAGDSQFYLPRDIAVDGMGRVYVVDASNNRIQKFSNNGLYMGKWGSAGSANGQFNVPNGIAIDVEGNIYVTDAQNHRIQKFTSSGQFIAKAGGYGTNPGQFNYPIGIAVDASGSLYIADSYNDRIQKFVVVD